MGLKHIIKRAKQFNPAVGYEMTLPGEPLIYSIKYPVGRRTRGLNFFRNMQFKSMFKCCFRAHMQTKVPTVLIIRFFVTPSEKEKKVTKAELKSETIPAVFAYELCDYLLSFMEMLLHVLINSYKQIVYIDAQKYYSANPRTTFKFMKWEHYVQLQNYNPDDSKAQRKRPSREKRSLQSISDRNEGDSPTSIESITDQRD